MALRQLCPSALNALSVAKLELMKHGHRLQSSTLRPGEILLDHKRKKDSSSVSHHQVASGRGCTSCVNLGRTRGPLTRASLDDADKQRKQPRGKSTAAMGQTSTTSGGVSGSKEFSGRQSLAITVFFAVNYVGLVLSFVPPQLHGYLGIIYTAQETVFRSNTVLRTIACVILFLHVVESSYAAHLALKVDPDNVHRWFLWTAFYGQPVLSQLMAKAKHASKSD